MRLCTFLTDAAGARLGLYDEAFILDIAGAGGPPDMMDAITRWPDARPAIEAAAARARRLPRAEARLLAPVPRPGKVLCSGINYRGHAAENPAAVMPTEPFFFAKLSTSVVGDGAAIVHPSRSRQVDYEVEFAAVIGRRLHRAPQSQAMAAVFGYTLLNDVSARDVQFKDSQITLGKNFDGFAPTGPCIVTADAMPAPERVRIRSVLNGRVMQDGSTSDWLFPLSRLLSDLSFVMALEPGDIVTTGTPAGVGLFQKPPVFMQPGDVISIDAEGIGALTNRIVAPPPP